MVAAASPRCFVLAGPSGVGKGTVIARLCQELPGVFGFSVSHTTRSPRTDERDGREYHFVTEEQFQKDRAAGRFLETATVHGQWYGTSWEAIERVRRTGRICVLDIDVQGVRSVRRAELPALVVFLMPPSMNELERRLRGRGTEDDSKIRRRLETAAQELVVAREEPTLFDAVIENDSLEETCSRIRALLDADIARVHCSISANTEPTD
jgi:guanylate kinase